MYGRQLIASSYVFPTHVSFDGRPKYKAGGISLDLTTLPAASGSDTNLGDGSIIKVNNQFLRYGQVLTKITAPATDTITIGGGATGGTFVAPVIVGGVTVNTSAITYSSGLTAATVQAAIVAASNVGAGNAVVSGSNGGPFTVTFANSLGVASIGTISPASLTGGTPTATVVSNAPGGNVGRFGPFDPNATDGRQILTRGECYVLDETWMLTPGGASLPQNNEIIGGVIEGGDIWIDRVLQSGTNAHSLAAGPTLAEFLAAFPSFNLVKN